MHSLVLAVALLNPVNLYSKPDAPVMVKIEAAARDKLEAKPTHLLLLSPDGTIEQKAALEADAKLVDLAKLFKEVGDGKTHYVQAVTAENVGVGAPLVVVPLWPNSPLVKKELIKRNGNKPMGLRVYVEQRIVFKTTHGDIEMALTPQYAPNTTWSFMHLAGNGFYDGVIFHRIIPGFVIQGGDPTGTGLGGPGYLLDLETSTKKHHKGTLSMARSGDPNSAGSQFFICLGRLPNLDPIPQRSAGYTTFGDVVKGLDVVDKIAAVKTGVGDRPVDPPKIKKAKLIPAPPRKIKRAER